MATKSRIKYISNIQISNRLVPKDHDALSSANQYAVKSEALPNKHTQSHYDVDTGLPLTREKCYSVKESNNNNR